MHTQHTKNLIVTPDSNFAEAGMVYHIGSKHSESLIRVFTFNYGNQDGDPEADVRLIEAGDNMLQTLHKVYVEIQTLVQKEIHQGNHMLSVDTDFMRTLLRNAIANATGSDCQDVQTEVESIAYKAATTNKK